MLDINDAIIAKKEKEILAPLNEQQRKPVTDFYGPSIIVAGAGSGKTSVVVARTQNMINHGIDPRNILLFTFTRKGAEEIRSRVEAGIGEKAKEVTMSTYHGFCCRLLRRYVETMGPWTRNFTIYDTEDCLNLIKPIVKNLREYDIDADAVLHTISSWKGKMMSPTDAAAKARGNDYYTACAKVYRQYAENMRASNAMDFDDLIYNTIRLLEGYPEIKAAVNKRYRYITAKMIRWPLLW
jgi:DNA helicase-2/ATP-dependent DNA helicase PcrA